MHFLHEWLWNIYSFIGIAGAIVAVFSLFSKMWLELTPPKVSKSTGKPRTKKGKESGKMRWRRTLSILAKNQFLILGIVLIIVGLSIASFNLYSNLQGTINSLQGNMTNLLDSVHYGLAFDSVTVGIENSLEGISPVTVGIRLQNTSESLIQYEVTNFSVILDNRTVENPIFLTTGGYISPGQTSDYFYPTIEGIDLSKPVGGTLEYEIHYSGVPNKYWYLSSRKLSLILWQGQATWRYLEEKESQISQP